MLTQPFGTLRIAMVAARFRCHNVEEFIAQFWQVCLTLVYRTLPSKLTPSKLTPSKLTPRKLNES
jgi:hypothetical protein